MDENDIRRIVDQYEGKYLQKEVTNPAKVAKLKQGLEILLRYYKRPKEVEFSEVDPIDTSRRRKFGGLCIGPWGYEVSGGHASGGRSTQAYKVLRYLLAAQGRPFSENEVREITRTKAKNPMQSMYCLKNQLRGLVSHKLEIYKEGNISFVVLEQNNPE